MSESRDIKEVNQIQIVDRDQIHVCTTQPRTHFDTEGLAELKASMQAHGFNAAWPLLVRESKAQAGKLELVFGERRFRVSGELGIDRLPVVVQELDDRTMFELQLVENMQRKSLTPIEEARAFVRMRDEFGYTIDQVAEKVGLGYETVAHRIKMLRAPVVMQEALDKGDSGIAERHLVLVAGIPDAGLREKCAKLVMTGEWDHKLQRNVPLTVARTKLIIRERFMVSLKGCAWSLDDAELLPEKGPCSGCDYLAAKFLAGTGELQDGGKGKGGIEPLTCCNPACFDAKKEAAWTNKVAESKAKGIQPLTAKERKEVFWEDGRIKYDSTWVPVTDKPPSHITQIYDDKKVPAYEKLLGQAKAQLEKKLAQLKDGTVVEMIPRKAAEALAKSLKQAGNLKRGKTELTAAEKKAKEKQALDNAIAAETKVQTLAIMHDAIIAKGVGVDEQRAVLDTMLNHAGMDGLRLMCDWLNVQPEKPTKKGENLNQGHYAATVLKVVEDAPKPRLEAMALIAFMAKNVKQGWALNYFVKPLMLAFGVKYEAIKKAAVEAVQARLAAKKAKVKTKVEKAPLKPGQKGVRKGAFDTGDSGAPVAKPGERTEPEQVYQEGEEAGSEVPVRDWAAEWAELPKKPGKDKPKELKAWNARRMQIKRGAAKAKVVLPEK